MTAESVSTSAMNGDLEQLLRRLMVLEDKEQITNLMVSYHRACDATSNKGSLIAACFSENGSWASVGTHGNAGWAATGRTALIAKFDRNVDRMPFSAHFLTNGLIATDGDTATGSWDYFQCATYRDQTALWMAGIYHVNFVRDNNEWLIAQLQVENWFTTPYDEGWAKTGHFETP